VPRGQRDGSLRQYSRFSRQEPLLFYQVAPRLYSRGWVDPVPDPHKIAACTSLTMNHSTSWRLYTSELGSTVPFYSYFSPPEESQIFSQQRQTEQKSTWGTSNLQVKSIIRLRYWQYGTVIFVSHSSFLLTSAKRFFFCELTVFSAYIFCMYLYHLMHCKILFYFFVIKWNCVQLPRVTLHTRDICLLH
jgi:hypothetical protein